MRVTDSVGALEAHLNVQWLRPESALWDAIASSVVSQAEFLSPTLEVGCGNGVFSFITAGGRFGPEYDGYRNADPRRSGEGEDLYDQFAAGPDPAWVTQRPDDLIDCAVDAKSNLLQQAQALAFYRTTVRADANLGLPFEDKAFQTVFSNMLYWLDSAAFALREVRRVLRPSGRAWLCLPDHSFRDTCISYRWREERSEFLRLLNRGRSDSIHWAISISELTALAGQIGLRLVSHAAYLSPVTLRAWDIGLRPLAPALIRMVQHFTEAERLSMKLEWMDILRPLLNELYELDRRSEAPGGFHFTCLERV